MTCLNSLFPKCVVFMVRVVPKNVITDNSQSERSGLRTWPNASFVSTLP